MPYTPTSPESVPVKQPSDQVLDKFHITKITIDVSPNDATVAKAYVEWCEGYDDAGTFISVRCKHHTCEGASWLVKMQELTADGASYYDAVKQGFWDYLAEQGLVPSGTVG